MVGVLAVSAPLEDYTVQPCKRQRKDEDPPSKTITNYFSPLSKSLDKGLGSPKSNNIADYFIRSSPAASKEATPPSISSRAGRRQGKRTKLIKRLSAVAPDSSVHSGFMGSDTAAMLAEICSQAMDQGIEDDDVVFQSETPVGGCTAKPQRGQRVRRTVGNGGPSVGGSSPEGHAASDTLTVSYEDFMRSQGPSSPAGPSDQTDPVAEDLPSPKMVTVQAQVHLSPPQQNSGRIASIFRSKLHRKKVAPERTGHGAPKRRSNVVIEEEDLELAVIDAETGEATKHRATMAERQQFMKAFRQAGDAPKARRTRKKELKEGAEEPGRAVPDEAEEPVRTASEEAEEPSCVEAEEPEKPTCVEAAEPSCADGPRCAAPEEPDRAQTLKRKKQPSAASPLTSPEPTVLRRSLRRQKSPERTLPESPDLMSTPIYKAEVLTLQSDTESPIRMRFTRVMRRGRLRRSDSEDETFALKVTESSKKISKARRIVEKAKAIQQSMVKGETLERRANRQKSRGQQEPESSSDQKITSTNLRSLNDVLGKRAKSLPPGQKKKANKKVSGGGVITIEDGSEVSENSQDDGQFRARREFLMSGLPDSMKRQIAKVSAMMEAYSVSSSSFQVVVHVQQQDGDAMWSLVTPRCRLLTSLSPLCRHVSDVTLLPLSLGDFTCVSSQAPVPPSPFLVTRRTLFSDDVQELLLEEIRLSNPQFPARRYLMQFLKKQSDPPSLQDAPRPAMKESVDGVGTIDCAESEIGNGTKRKRKDPPCPKSKRRKAATSVGDDLAQSSRSSRRRRRGGGAAVVNTEELDPGAPAEELAWEDMLWTEKYQPQNSEELIGNSAPVRRIHSWLREWKLRVEKEEKRSQMQKTGKDKDDPWSAGEDSDEEFLCNTLLISGPPGVGKTAAVYACAQELGFKVFEVNASCQRSGRQILAQLKEATQSHQVDQQGVHAQRPCFFSSNSRSPRKLCSPRKVVSSPRKPPMSPRGAGPRKGLAPKSLTNYFKAAPKKPTPVKAPQSSSGVKAAPPVTEEAPRRTATSLILFEEVDIIFEDDCGFLNAVKTFMSTTKRPVILTTSDPAFGMTFDGAFEEIAFHPPSLVNVASFLQVLCLAENLRTDTKDLMTFVTANRGDIRRSVLQLQFWARSGGGAVRTKPLPPPDNQRAEASAGARDVPGCSVGCAQHLLGVHNIITPTASLIPFMKERVAEAAARHQMLRVLTEFHSRNIHFTASNLELLLPLPVRILEPATTLVPEDAHVKGAAATRHRRRAPLLLDDSDLFDNDSNSVGEILDVVTQEVSGAPEAKRALSPAERQASLLVCRCLDSMAEFAEHMSFLDCSTCDTSDPAYTCRPSWTQSRLKHGLCDGCRTESQDRWGAQSSAEIRGHIEAFALCRCSSTLSTTLASSLEACRQSGADPTEDLALCVTGARGRVEFEQPVTSADIAQSRLSVVKDVLSHRAFISLGNRDANVTEYLPALRSICRLQKVKEEGKTKRRFLHYLEGIHLELPKVTLSRLAAAFP